MKVASVTDLKNQLSAHLKSVVGGEAFLVTDHGKPVAVLQPLGADFREEGIAGLVAAGILALPKQNLQVNTFLKLPKGKSSKPLTAAVLEDREGR